MVEQGTQRQIPNLSPRQIQVVELITEGLDNNGIAVRLGIGLSTVKVHKRTLSEAMRSSGVKGDPMVHALFFGLERGCINLDLFPLVDIGLLTDAQKKVFAEVLKAKQNAQIALDLDVGEKTVAAHLGAIYRKFNVSNKYGAIGAFFKSTLTSKASGEV